MPYADLGNSRIFYLVDGPENAPWLVLSNSLGANADMWSRQVSQLARHFRVLRYDSRGHGHSSTPEGEYSMADLGGDLSNLLKHLNIEKAHVCGLSIGGMTAMWLALAHPEQVDRLVLCNTSSRIGSIASWQERIATVNANGVESMAYELIQRWLSANYLAKHPESSQTLIDMIRRMSTSGYAATCAALRDADLDAEVQRITAQVLVVGGKHDLATTPEATLALTAKIPGAQYYELDAAHISNWEQPSVFSNKLIEFLS
ncbi:3-oxoadipate enol-lactonase [Alcaligenaceae bacterium]|nr:3-oxoadipate enol-lactonase [Alcaligenaceae bacterium]